MNDRFKLRYWNISSKRFMEPYATRDGVPLYADGSEWDFDYIVSQCTGLKDKNGNLIYEGDIVKFIDMGEQIGKIDFINSCALFQVNYLTKEDWAFLDKREYEVIGNVYQNPELLNKEDK